MIALCRIDDRLVHGQVAFTWVPALGINHLIVANDQVAGDEFQKLALGLAAPRGVTQRIMTVEGAVAFLNDPASTPLKILVLVKDVPDAARLARDVPAVTSINFGGIRSREGGSHVSKAVALTEGDIALVKALLEKGIELEVRQVPTDTRQRLENLL
ncbi:MAG TPA: PTS sugar transporter subunit IIB [Dinghuibacter sp.]|jgi:mannose/fructose/N-acetylgalactosamine-specific phosphotransferase system component IIB|uniref:PTS system mannose/fructose/N-acetylgalactosamine-transporter subunit IIB n=1 Tax=Dinghuibacter sp. TaxID=2024697 RepID=UPI002D0DDB38|nr:PTS sugar transporter subunit IIB [Dinghuibacter sp.]HTJ10882.1 PTS sugar transporter subunit IIB [Dinghuibacter sp.]